jgi:hypothetical protein
MHINKPVIARTVDDQYICADIQVVGLGISGVFSHLFSTLS